MQAFVSNDLLGFVDHPQVDNELIKIHIAFDLSQGFRATSLMLPSSWDQDSTLGPRKPCKTGERNGQR